MQQNLIFPKYRQILLAVYDNSFTFAADQAGQEGWREVFLFLEIGVYIRDLQYSDLANLIRYEDAQ